MEFIKYPSINSLKNLAYELKSSANFHGVTAETINFTGTVKVHGTNAAIVYNPHDESYHCQSRVRILGEGKQDNDGFCGWVNRELGLDGVTDMLGDALEECFQDEDIAIVIYGEWCGGGIQKGVSISGMEKQFVIFDVQIISGHSEVEHEEGIEVVWERESICHETLHLDHKDVHWIGDFGEYEVTVDFNNLVASKNQLDYIRDAIEDNCPVGADLNPDSPNTTGEGVVFTGFNSKGEQVMFKHKGSKHKCTVRAPKVPFTDRFEPEQMVAIQTFAEEALSGRLDQGIEMMKLEGHPPLIQTTGKYISWVLGDIKKELGLELNELKTDHGIIAKDVFTVLNPEVKNHWMEYIKEENE